MSKAVLPKTSMLLASLESGLMKSSFSTKWPADGNKHVRLKDGLPRVLYQECSENR